jgi:hypothetical protein
MSHRTHSWRRWAPALLLAGLLLAPLAGAGGAAAAPAGQATKYPTTPVPDPHQAGVLYFPATGHTLRGAFRAYWEQHGGLAQFGYPITEEFVDDKGPTAHFPITVQYFERNRFEHHPENAGTPFEVQLGLLGASFHQPESPVAASGTPGSQYMNGHNVSARFYTYWKDHGGLAINGYPISEQAIETSPTDGRPYAVQYFERARYEYHPDRAGTPYDVMLGLLGTQMAHQIGLYPPVAGAYPLTGHAADFSWIAGRVAVTRIQGGCVFVQYDGGGNVQPVGDGWTAAQDSALARDGAYVVLFGHMAGPDEPRPMCPAPAFVVDKVQANSGS